MAIGDSGQNMEVAVKAADKECKKEQENVMTPNPLQVEKIVWVHTNRGEIAKSKTVLVIVFY